MKSVIRFVVMVSILATLILTSTTPALAGSNGQQISFYACNASKVVIQGYNQDGNWITKTIDNPPCSWYKLSGWWWKSKDNAYVTLTPYYYLSSEYPNYADSSKSVFVPVSQTNNDWIQVEFPTPSTRQFVQWRAWTWVNDKVSYIYGGIGRDGYKQDCSGYVSFAWQTPKPGFGTSQWDTYSYTIPFDSLQPGDALNSVDGEHIVIFMGWVNQSAGTFNAYEENTYYGGAHLTKDITLNKSTGKLTLSGYEYPGKYFAIRKDGL